MDTDDDVAAQVDPKDLDKVAEYFRLKKVAKLLRRDIKDLKDQHENANDIKKLAKELKELRDDLKEDEQIHELSEKLSQANERMKLIKEMLRVELIETSQEEVKKDDEDKKLKLVYVLKEVKASEK